MEVQGAVALYTEKSPLYGFVHFRRRRVLLKVVPEGTSRLLQGQSDASVISVIQRSFEGANCAIS